MSGALCSRPTYLFIKPAKLGGDPSRPATEGNRASERMVPTCRFDRSSGEWSGIVADDLDARSPLSCRAASPSPVSGGRAVLR